MIYGPTGLMQLWHWLVWPRMLLRLCSAITPTRLIWQDGAIIADGFWLGILTVASANRPF